MSIESQQNTFIKLVTLWVIVEAFLGGIIHATKIPVSGILIGGCAALCICFIAYYEKSKSKILVATMLVSIFKMLLSPHSPLPAYIAVFFQGALGFLIFQNTNFFTLRCILFTCISFFESAVQRVLVTTIIYGKDFWQTLNVFIQDLTGDQLITNYSLLLIASYIIVHLVLGFIIGWYISSIPLKLESFVPDRSKSTSDKNLFAQTPKQRKYSQLKWIVVIAGLVICYFLSQKGLAFQTKMAKQILGILFRSAIILSIWKFLLGPLLTKALTRMLTKQKGKYAHQIKSINELLPLMKSTVNDAWVISKHLHANKIQRINYMVLHTMHSILTDDEK